MPKKRYDDSDLKEKAMALRHKGYSYREIAKELGCSLFKVSQLISDVEQPQSRLKKLAEIDGRIKDLNSNLNVVSSWVADINRRMPDVQHVEKLIERVSKIEEYVKKEEEAIKDRGSYYRTVQDFKDLSKQVKDLNKDVKLIWDLAALNKSGEYQCLNFGEDGYCKVIRYRENYKELDLRPKESMGITFYHPNVQRHTLICQGCPEYKREQIDDMEDTDKDSQSSAT